MALVVGLGSVGQGRYSAALATWGLPGLHQELSREMSFHICSYSCLGMSAVEGYMSPVLATSSVSFSFCLGRPNPADDDRGRLWLLMLPLVCFSLAVNVCREGWELQSDSLRVGSLLPSLSSHLTTKEGLRGLFSLHISQMCNPPMGSWAPLPFFSSDYAVRACVDQKSWGLTSGPSAAVFWDR